MRLQRSAGNAAVSRLLARKFGFEVETNIGLRNIADATFVKKDATPWEKTETEQKVVTTHPTSLPRTLSAPAPSTSRSRSITIAARA